MPFLPIDLQTMFAQMNQVGKEQAIQREVSPLLQSLQGSELVKRAEHQGTEVNETHDVGDGLENVNEEGNGANRQAEHQNDRRESSANRKVKEVFKDPDLGHYVDISG